MDPLVAPELQMPDQQEPPTPRMRGTRRAGGVLTQASVWKSPEKLSGHDSDGSLFTTTGSQLTTPLDRPSHPPSRHILWRVLDVQGMYDFLGLWCSKEGGWARWLRWFLELSITYFTLAVIALRNLSNRHLGNTYCPRPTYSACDYKEVYLDGHLELNCRLNPALIANSSPSSWPETERHITYRGHQATIASVAISSSSSWISSVSLDSVVSDALKQHSPRQLRLSLIAQRWDLGMDFAKRAMAEVRNQESTLNVS
ncbi:hypothetical protein PCANC_19184 [Puccinia coronata f. sp. avenae]|uniref:Uncharacterized protein n=1 Tax=Puccinia coronata f. sp. avenae TaxID=200324 RepID=A0A2N5U2H1_9BASI|nr:hypothetical protein PCANC_19184 [Puccinia coronata f. sp. avenae]